MQITEVKGPYSFQSGSRLFPPAWWEQVRAQLAVPEPTLAETVGCRIDILLNRALRAPVLYCRRPKEAAKAMLFGHIQGALRGSRRSPSLRKRH